MNLILKVAPFLSCCLVAALGHTQGFEGPWQGSWNTGMTPFRVAMVFHQEKGAWHGSFNNIDEGLYGVPLEKIRVKANELQAELATGEVFDLRLDPSYSRLEGTCLQVDGHFQRPGEKGSVLLTPGGGYLIPRSSKTYSYHLPQKLSDGWEVGDLRDLKVDRRPLLKGLQKAADGTFPNIHSVVIAQGGKLVVDEYFYGYGPGDVHPLQSITKSVFSILMGIAMGQGKFALEDRLFDDFPEYRGQRTWSAAKNGITVRSLLTMTSGLACDDWNDSTSCSWAMVDSPNWLDFSLDQPLAHEPGLAFAYCGACLTPLSVLLARKTGMEVPTFARKDLLEPLGMGPIVWMRGPHGVTPASFGLSMRPRDLAKLGLLYLRQGSWEGKPVVPSKWVEGSLCALVPASKTHGKGDYGYLWWSKDIEARGVEFRVHFAWGVGGQYLFLVPELDLVCVVLAGNENDSRLGAHSWELFKDLVLPAFVRNGPQSPK